MTEKVKCSACGTLILPLTAKKNGGFCVPCKKGYRESINAARESEKTREARRKEWEASPPGIYLRRISDIEIGSKGGFFKLSENDQKYLAICLLDGEVHNGGFHQFFFNSPGGYYLQAVSGLLEIGAAQSAKLLKEAKELLFGHSAVPQDTTARRSLLPELSSNLMSPSATRRLYELDDLYCNSSDALFKLLDKFAETKCLYPRF